MNFRSVVHWSLTVVTAIYLLSGFGITEYRIVGSLTFGLLTKVVAYQIHMSLVLPFVGLLACHICLTILSKVRPRTKDEHRMASVQ